MASQIIVFPVGSESVKRALKSEERLQQENVALREEVDKASMFEEIVGASPALMAALSRVCKVAGSDSTVLITGETGTGKELVARAIHRRSRRASRAFVAVNCATIPRDLISSELFGHEKGAFTGAVQRRLGRFELANGGTIFLDEVGELSSETQVALLRVLQEREFERVGGRERIQVDVRVIAATNRDLTAAVADGTFRQDLFYRLNVFPVEMPPLRERREDIPLLAETFARAAADRYELPQRVVGQSALRRLVEYNWPGNVRELKNTMDRAIIVAEGEELTSRDLPDEITAGLQKSANDTASKDGGLSVPFTADFREDRREFERRYIGRCLEHTQGNVTRAAEILGMHRQSLQHKLRQLGLGRRYVSVSQEAQEIPDI